MRAKTESIFVRRKVQIQGDKGQCRSNLVLEFEPANRRRSAQHQINMDGWHTLDDLLIAVKELRQFKTDTKGLK